MVILRNVDFSYRIGTDRIPVLEGLNAVFERGRITALVGASGCGKTSLLRVIAGLSRPDSGLVQVDDAELSGIRRGTSIIFQDHGLLPWETVRGNAELGMKLAGVPAPQRRAQVDPILEELGLEPFEALYPARLSGGMRQRVAIARALASESDLLLLDEPFSSLDAIAREAMQDTLLATQKRHGTTVILVTHSIEEAAYLADTVYILEGRNPARIAESHRTARFAVPASQIQPAPAASEVAPYPGRPSVEVPGNQAGVPSAWRENPAFLADLSELRRRFALATAPGRSPPEGAQESRPAAKARRRNSAASGGEPGRFGKMALAMIAALVLWAGLAALVRKPFLPAPLLAFGRLFELFGDGTLPRHIGASLRRIGLALAIASPFAWGLGLLAGRTKTADTLLSPLIYLFHPLPKVAFLPLLMLFLGLGDASKVALMGLVVFGQLFVGARDAGHAVAPPLLDTVRSLGGGRGSTLWHAVVPATTPALISSLRVSLGTCIAVLFLSETFASMDGLGWLIMDAWSRIEYPEMYAAILALSGVGLLLYLVLDAAERLLLRWREVD